VPGERVGARLEGWQAEGGARAGAPCCTAPNNALEPTPTASARASLWLLARLTAGVRETTPWGTGNVVTPHAAVDPAP